MVSVSPLFTCVRRERKYRETVRDRSGKELAVCVACLRNTSEQRWGYLSATILRDYYDSMYVGKDSSRLYLHLLGIRSSDCSMRADIAVRTTPPRCQVPCWGSRYSMSLKLFTVASSLFGHFLCDSCSYSNFPVDKSPLLISTTSPITIMAAEQPSSSASDITMYVPTHLLAS